MNEKQRQAEWKARHLKALATLGFTGSYRTLKTLENRAHRNAEQYCNDPYYGGIEGDEYERRQEVIAEQVKRLFGGTLPAGFFINGDPRGYALKINAGNEAGMTYHPEYIPEGLHKDWGGYGILAPDEF
jgi:hypothetical protein